MFRSLKLAVVMAALAWGNQAVEACRCRPPPPPKQSLAQSGAVFLGKVTDIQYNDAGRYKIATLEVTGFWKGEVGKTVKVRTSISSAACGYNFQKDNVYLVYCLKPTGKQADAKQQVFQTNICTRTRPISQAKEDIKAFGEGKKPGGDAKNGE